MQIWKILGALISGLYKSRFGRRQKWPRTILGHWQHFPAVSLHLISLNHSIDKECEAMSLFVVTSACGKFDEGIYIKVVQNLRAGHAWSISRKNSPVCFQVGFSEYL
jgi:hypothetical protein